MSPLNLIFPINLNGPPTVIFKWSPNNNINPGDPGPLNLIFANQFKWAPNNNIVPGGPSPFNLIFASQFKNALYNNIQMP